MLSKHMYHNMYHQVHVVPDGDDGHQHMIAGLIPALHHSQNSILLFPFQITDRLFDSTFLTDSLGALNKYVMWSGALSTVGPTHGQQRRNHYRVAKKHDELSH